MTDNKVTQEQIDALAQAIREAVILYAASDNSQPFMRTARNSNYWACEVAIIGPGDMRYRKKGPMRSDFTTGAILDLKTGLFMKGTISKAGIRVTKGQPKNPPSIDNYTLGVTGAVADVGYRLPDRVRFSNAGGNHSVTVSGNSS